MRKQQGFTLVELAIVMIIIGLLIGGVLKGQEMIENAKVTGLIDQVTAYRAAYHSFRDTYAATPGDMANATTRLAGCDAANFCGNGSGNGIIGNPTGDFQNQAGSTTLPAVETTYFWKHLVLAQLITGVEPNGNPAAPAWGVTHPASKMRGGFHVNHDTADRVLGHKLRLPNPANSAPDPGAGQRPISPIRAAQIDRKLDDGRANTGSVTAANSDAGWAGCARSSTGQYVSTTTKNCLLWFSLD